LKGALLIMNKPKIGLLPLYLELYDRSLPELRQRINEFHAAILNELKRRDLEVVNVPVCRLKPEFEAAVKTFESEQVDAVVTLHLAYSPSLEFSDVLASTRLPVIVLDTTPTYGFGPEQASDEILYNHGIHGVQDMCNLLIRNKKSFLLEAGHWKESDVLDRAASCARAAKLANSVRNARVGRIGEPFSGMGDFHIPVEVLHSTIGMETVVFDFRTAGALISEISEEEIRSEINYDMLEYVPEGIDSEVHRRSTIANLAVRKWIEREKLTAFTVNFTAIEKASGISCMPFLEASKAMARGIGYAGEGDVLTAGLVGALASVYSETSFIEMFCPDWKNNSIFLSHMGEMNINLAAEKPRLIEKDFPFTDADNPVVAYARFKPGKAVIVDLAPGADNTYSLIVSPVEMLGVEGEDKLNDSIHGWFRPSIPVQDFLSAYSTAGGTHHLALVYGEFEDEILKFGRMMGWKVVKIG